MGAEDPRARGQGITTDALEHRRAVVDHVRHNMQPGIIPVNQLAVVPNFFAFLDGHPGAPSPGRYNIRRGPPKSYANILAGQRQPGMNNYRTSDRKSTRLNSSHR